MRRVSGSLFGLAYGDALGAPTEFLNMKQIHERFGQDGPRDFERTPALVTDDTQMALAVAEGLVDALRNPPFTAKLITPMWRRRFVDWLHDPENNRAPGNTCLRACERLDRGLPWEEATQIGSKGCGANMRVTPVGLAPGLTDDSLAGASQLQAALTHGHPTALAASELTAFTTRWLADGMAPAALPATLRERALAQRTVYREDWLGALWTHAQDASPEAFIARGWDDCLAVLDRLDAALLHPDRTADPCAATGAGWIAEEAFATGLYCFLLFPDDPVSAIWRGAASSGDSDSIACLAGAFAGAHQGMDAWPTEWSSQIEYSARLQTIAKAWD
ncbi:ADP-ribosylglycohydrolase family protein [Actinomadura rupiterrae]|uniref:ADP-ribosylglycohydrolase family protein n=1 Tax=Actinomadura rupiterrae TaxID=559627 RepID=UPI0020A4D0B7|nr:ADP-ribosylglycohydrolase family protein [Actinomadura rupiterrae]MCP2336424.1 ADP-ribosylglycohydrolase [Actinomadura rupiterrae]